MISMSALQRNSVALVCLSSIAILSADVPEQGPSIAKQDTMPPIGKIVLARPNVARIKSTVLGLISQERWRTTIKSTLELGVFAGIVGAVYKQYTHQKPEISVTPKVTPENPRKLADDPAFQEMYLNWLKNEVHNQEFGHRVRSIIKWGVEISILDIFFSRIWPGPINTIRNGLDQVWNLWNTPSARCVQQIIHVAGILDVLRTKLEGFADHELTNTDCLFYKDQVVGTHQLLIDNFEELCALMSIDLDDETVNAWILDQTNGFWDAVKDFTTKLEKDLNQYYETGTIQLSESTQISFQQVHEALSQLVDTYSALSKQKKGEFNYTIIQGQYDNH